jgi:hypothetical protein
MSSQRGNGTNRDWVAANVQLQRRDFELLDDLKSLVEQEANIARETHKPAPMLGPTVDAIPVPPPQTINSRDQLTVTREPHLDEKLPPAPSHPKRMRTTDLESDDNSVSARLTHVPSRAQSREEPLPPRLQKFLGERPDPTKEVTGILKRRGLAMLGYATLALISAGGISFAAVQLFSARSPNVNAAESGTSGIGSTIPAINQPVAIVLPRLRLSKVNEVEGKPVFLGISVENPRPDSFILIREVPPGSLITKGSRAGKDGWRVPVQELAYAILNPPQNFVGTMALSVDLKNGDDAVADSDVQQLSWSSAEPSAEAQPAPAKRGDASKIPRVSSLQNELPVGPSGNVETVRLPTSSAPLVDEPQRSPAAAQPVRLIPQSSIASLLSRANTALETGDIAAARLLLQRAAEAGEVKAAMSLASTYDPAVLRRLRTLGAQSDIAAARRWYEKAAELGSREAMQRLKELH